jgi:hypothetical protein
MRGHDDVDEFAAESRLRYAGRFDVPVQVLPIWQTPDFVVLRGMPQGTTPASMVFAMAIIPFGC